MRFAVINPTMTVMIHRFKLFIAGVNAYTLVIWAWLVLEFFTHNQIRLPVSMSTIYLTLVGVYVGDKELARSKKKYRARGLHGELFVLLWLATLIGVSLVVAFGGYRNGYRIPADLPVIAGTVLVLWLATQYLKEQRER